MPPSISRCGWCRRTAAARAIPELVNAVLRRVTRDGPADLAAIDTARLDTPEWLMARWTARYGEETAHAIAGAHAAPPPLDVSVKGDPEDWAARLRGRVLPTGTVRAQVQGPISRLPGFDEGGWWVQDAAAALPARLFGDVRGRSVADLCAAPGGKAAQLALAGARGHRGRSLGRPGSAACKRISRVSDCRLNWSLPTSPNGRADHSMPSCSTRLVCRPGPFAVIRTSPGSSASRTSCSSRICRQGCSTARLS